MPNVGYEWYGVIFNILQCVVKSNLVTFMLQLLFFIYFTHSVFQAHFLVWMVLIIYVCVIFLSFCHWVWFTIFKSVKIVNNLPNI